MTTERISTGYVARPLQQKLHSSLKRNNVLVCHRRFGKSVFGVNHMIHKGIGFMGVDPLTGGPLLNPRYAYLAPLYSQAKRVMWDYLKTYTSKIPGVTVNEADLRVDIPRPSLQDTVRFTLLGADNPVSLKGIYLDGVILDEYAEMNPTAWREVIRPTLTDRLGWSLFIGTPKGQNSFYDLYERARSGDDPNWFAAMFKASETGIISKEELEATRKEMTEEEYMQEFECSFTAALVGAYFGKELTRAETEKRICEIPHEQSFPVDTYWDLGINDTTAVWFVQTVRGAHRFIDHYEICGASLPEIMNDLQKKPYTYGEFVLPHDAEARDLSTGKSQTQVFYSLGCRNVRIVPRVGSKRESINAARMAFNKCHFDDQKTKQGRKALAQYQRKWNSKNNVFEDAPLHNWASNTADAFQTFAMGVREDSGRVGLSGYRKEPQYEKAETDFNPFQRGA